MCIIGSLPGVSSLRLVQAGFFSLSLSWSRPSVPVQGYRLTYGPQGQKLSLSYHLLNIFFTFALVLL